jgi:hypothetical protein
MQRKREVLKVGRRKRLGWWRVLTMFDMKLWVWPFYFSVAVLGLFVDVEVGCPRVVGNPAGEETLVGVSVGWYSPWGLEFGYPWTLGVARERLERNMYVKQMGLTRPWWTVYYGHQVKKFTKPR